MTDEKKLIVIGLDGGTFKLIKPWITKDSLPNIAKLMKNGVYGTLKSTMPPITFPAWPSFMTGCNPGKHGIHGFVHESRVYTYKDLKVKAFWDILGKRGFTSLVVNVPLTYPPHIINGIMIASDMLSQEESYAYPPKIEYKLNEINFIPYIDSNTMKTLRSSGSQNKLYSLIEKKTVATLMLADEYNFDLIVLVYREPDIFSHIFWHDKKRIKRVYKLIDKEIGHITTKYPKANYILMSDHGFSDFEKQINVNQFLYQLGYLNRKKIVPELSSEKSGRIMNTNKYKLSLWFKDFFEKIGLTQEKVIKNLPSSIIKLIRAIIPENIRRSLPSTNLMIDIENSKAFMPSNEGFGIRINRENLHDYDKFRDELIEKLGELKDPEYNQKVFEWVKRREEVYSGKYVDNALDIMLKPKNEYLLSRCWGIDVIEKNDLYYHDFEGIFIASGPEFKRDEIIKNAEIIDIAPTVLHFFDLPIPNYMDGRVLKEIFGEKTDSAKREVEYADISYYKDERIRIKHMIEDLKFEKRI